MDLVKKDLVTIDLTLIGPVMVGLAKINLLMAARMAWRTTYAVAVNDIKENKK